MDQNVKLMGEKVLKMAEEKRTVGNFFWRII